MKKSVTYYPNSDAVVVRLHNRRMTFFNDEDGTAMEFTRIVPSESVPDFDDYANSNNSFIVRKMGRLIFFNRVRIMSETMPLFTQALLVLQHGVDSTVTFDFKDNKKIIK